MARLGLAEVLRRGQVDDLLGLEGQRRAAVCAGSSARPGLGVSLIGQFGCVLLFLGCFVYSVQNLVPPGYRQVKPPSITSRIFGGNIS